MSIIHLLPDSVANQIAAGEVIQRPASVIKELMENAIDAGATSVHVLVTGAGKSVIQVIDNGSGMTEDDALLAFERHATSKIVKAADLFNLNTMGFRGEALASIAAVAQVELRTRTAEQQIGFSLNIEGSRITQQEPVSCPVGANFIIRNLFFNVPARRRFLKSDATELSNIITEFQRVALAFPDKSFKLSSNDNILMDLPAGNFRQRIAAVFGRKLDSQLIPVEVSTELVRISGFVGSPESGRKKSPHQYFFANNRFMRHAYFAKAVQHAYERLLPQGEQIPYFLRFDTEPNNIDVNIHPTKTEIKFADEQSIWQILSAAIHESLAKYNQIPSIDFDTENRPEIPAFISDDLTMPLQPDIKFDTTYNPFRKSSSVSRLSSVGAHTPVLGGNNGEIDWQQEETAGRTETIGTLFDREVFPSTANPSDYLQYNGQYIILPVKSGLMFVHQHRAHVRVLYDQYLQQMISGKIQTQGLLFPQPLTLSPALQLFIENNKDILSKAGFEISMDEKGIYQLDGIPVGTEGLDPLQLFENVVDAMTDLENESSETNQTAHILSLSIAHRAAMPVGVVLSQEEMAHLMEKLFAGAMPNYTPDGKKILIVLSNEMLENQF